MAAAPTIDLGSRPAAAGQGAPNLVPDDPQPRDSMNLDASEELLSDGDLEMNEKSNDKQTTNFSYAETLKMVKHSGTALRIANGTQQGTVGTEEEQAILNFEDDVDEDTNEISMFSDSEGLGINIKQSAIERWAQPWHFSVVVKLFNRFIGYRILKDILKKVWNLANPFEMLDLGNNYFLIRFSTEEEWSHVLLGGPWMVLGTYLVMQPWSPNFDVEDTQPASLTVWVRVPGLPIHFYKRRFLEAIGNALG